MPQNPNDTILRFPIPEKHGKVVDLIIFSGVIGIYTISYYDCDGDVKSENVIKFVEEFYNCKFRQINWKSGNGHNDIIVQRC